jgi:hypothetical protein
MSRMQVNEQQASSFMTAALAERESSEAAVLDHSDRVQAQSTNKQGSRTSANTSRRFAARAATATSNLLATSSAAALSVRSSVSCAVGQHGMHVSRASEVPRLATQSCRTCEQALHDMHAWR